MHSQIITASKGPSSSDSPCISKIMTRKLIIQEFIVIVVASHSGSVQLKNLTLIRWKDDQGKTQRFYLMDKIAYKWRTLGELLDLSFSKLQNLATEHREKPNECCRAVLGQWLNNPPPDYPTTWQGLLELLDDSQLGQVVMELKVILGKASF